MRPRLLLVIMLGLVVAMTGAGVAGAQQSSAGPTAAAATGTLVFQHDATGRGTLGAAVRLFGDDDDVAGLTGDVADGGNAGEISEGQRVQKALPPGEHQLILFTEGSPDLLGTAEFTIVAGETVTVLASRVLAGGPAPVRIPTRVDTGAGGAAPGAAVPLAAPLVTLAALVAGGLALRRRTHSPTRG